MKFCCRCGVCNNIFIQDDEDILLEFDFKEQKISFFCRNPKCKQENVMDFKTWQKKQEHSPLPLIGVMR